MSNEIKTEPGYNSEVQSPLGCGGFVGLFGGNDDAPMPMASSSSSSSRFFIGGNNNELPSTSTSASAASSTDVAVYRKPDCWRENFVIDEQLLLPALMSVQPPTSNDLSLDIFPFDQVGHFSFH